VVLLCELTAIIVSGHPDHRVLQNAKIQRGNRWPESGKEKSFYGKANLIVPGDTAGLSQISQFERADA